MNTKQRKEMREVVNKRIFQLKNGFPYIITQCHKKKSIHPAHKQLKGRIEELRRLKRHLYYSTFPESYIHGKEVNTENIEDEKD